VSSGPFADRIAGEVRFLLLREVGAVGVDRARQERLEMDIGDLRENDPLDWPDDRHHSWHAVGHAGVAVVDTLSAIALVFETRLQDFLVLGLERRLLGEPGALVLVPLYAHALRAQPLSAPVGEF